MPRSHICVSMDFMPRKVNHTAQLSFTMRIIERNYQNLVEKIHAVELNLMCRFFSLLNIIQNILISFKTVIKVPAF